MENKKCLIEFDDIFLDAPFASQTSKLGSTLQTNNFFPGDTSPRV